ncbi:hypothetical protein BBD39_07420 [Arsenophonus endosymbiont of Bemisia tabaci Asia II 3]|nr:hypothetical protein BBD39_07420 [Arsenophonus endosymbiont of Bemisia tabaci Asia II 3]
MKGWQLGIAIIIVLQINNCYAAMLFFSSAQTISCPFSERQHWPNNFDPSINNEKDIFTQKKG